MDDRKVFELERLKLAYQKQVIFLSGLILMTLIGLIAYVVNIYDYEFALLVASLVLMITGIIGIMSIDQKMKTISMKIKEL